MVSHKILIVDDNAVQRELITARLEKVGHEVLQADNGQAALEVVEQQEDLDLVLLDLNMPGVSGHDVLDEIRRYRNSIDLPVIMVTAEEETKAIISSFEKGANDYILKQVSFKIALQRINTQLKLTEMAKASAKAHQVAAINAMIVTYNHEINNPLAIAYGNLGHSYDGFNEERYGRTVKAIERIRDLVKKIQELDTDNVEFSDYTSKSKMLKIT